MKLSKKQLRNLIREEFLRTVPEFMLQGETQKMVSSLSNLVRRHILASASNPSDRDEALSVMDKVMHELEVEINDLIEQKVWKILELT